MMNLYLAWQEKAFELGTKMVMRCLLSHDYLEGLVMGGSLVDFGYISSAVRDGWEIYDTDAHVDGKKLRFVAYRTSEDIRAGVEYHRTQGKKEAEALIKRFGSKLYNCDVDAKRDLDEVLPLLEDYAFRVRWSIDPVEISIGYGHRGRPRKDEKPRMKTEYRVNILLKFDEEKAKELSKDRGVSVLVTNLPRTNEDADNIRYGATADTVL